MQIRAILFLFSLLLAGCSSTDGQPEPVGADDLPASATTARNLTFTSSENFTVVVPYWAPAPFTFESKVWMSGPYWKGIMMAYVSEDRETFEMWGINYHRIQYASEAYRNEYTNEYSIMCFESNEDGTCAPRGGAWNNYTGYPIELDPAPLPAGYGYLVINARFASNFNFTIEAKGEALFGQPSWWGSAGTILAPELLVEGSRFADIERCAYVAWCGALLGASTVIAAAPDQFLISRIQGDVGFAGFNRICYDGDDCLAPINCITFFCFVDARLLRPGESTILSVDAVTAPFGAAELTPLVSSFWFTQRSIAFELPDQHPLRP